MDGEVIAVATVGPVVRARRRQQEGAEEADAGGELVVDSHEPLRRGPSPAGPAAGRERDPDITTLVGGDSREAEAESVVEDGGLGQEPEA